jgi:tRNA C32,U32 (ribose-2'-O)-methylase TrmJ
VPSANTFDRVNFDLGQGSFDFYGKVKTVAVFKEALSDTELACLTSTNNREIFLNYYYRMQYLGANTEAIDCAQIKLNV